mmetsp:Transcript_7675/g.20136  ORF Transcript_7675/g.20136 Transcript_7675/m.20136 type:complete len:122 (-) Transcript_7675:257-622(-)
MMWTLRMLTTPIKDQTFDASSIKATGPQGCTKLVLCCMGIYPAVICYNECCQRVRRNNLAGETMEETVIQTVTKPDMEKVHQWLYSAISDSQHDALHVYTHLFKAGLVLMAAPPVDVMSRN